MAMPGRPFGMRATNLVLTSHLPCRLQSQTFCPHIIYLHAPAYDKDWQPASTPNYIEDVYCF